MGACQRWTSLPFKRPEASVPSQVPWAWGCPWSRSFLDTVSVGFFVAHGAVSLRVISGLQNLRGWQAGKPGEQTQSRRGWAMPYKPAPYSEGQTGARHQPARGYHLLCTVLWYLSPLRRNYMLWKFLFYCTLVRISPRRATASREYEWGLELFLRDASARWPSAYRISLRAFEAWSTAFSGHSPFTPLMGFKAT